MLHKSLTLLLACAFMPAGFASSLQDWEFNVNGMDYYPANGNTFASVPGLDASAYSSATGQGSLTLTFNPGSPGSYYLGAFFFVPVGIPFYNEYGVVNGSPLTGQTWQIDIPEYDVTTPNHGSGTIVDNLAAGALNGINSVPGTNDNYLNGCGANGGGSSNANCNDFVSLAMGFNFTLNPGEEEVVTLNLSPTATDGFSLEAVHPVDGSNPTSTGIFYSGSAITQPAGGPPPPISPEPASWALLAGGIALLAAKQRYRLLNR